jgi:hypothetical protein
MIIISNSNQQHQKCMTPSATATSNIKNAYPATIASFSSPSLSFSGFLIVVNWPPYYFLLAEQSVAIEFNSNTQHPARLTTSG